MDTEFLRQELNMLAMLIHEVNREGYLTPEDLRWCYQYSNEVYSQLGGIDPHIIDET